MPCVVLLIIDGYGVAPASSVNAVALAKTPYLHKLLNRYPSLPLKVNVNNESFSLGCASGHMAIGASKTQINSANTDANLFIKDEFLNTLKHAKKHNSTLHLIGYLHQEDEYNDLEYLYTVLRITQKYNLNKILIHGVLEGDYNAYSKIIQSINNLSSEIAKTGNTKIASLSGSWYADDTQGYWQRTEKEYNIIVSENSKYVFSNPLEILNNFQSQNIAAHQIHPSVIINSHSTSHPKTHAIHDNDSIIFFNSKPGSLRNLITAFVNQSEAKFLTYTFKNVSIATLINHNLTNNTEFTAKSLNQSLGKIISYNNLSQLRITTTDAYPYLTYFFNGGVKEAYPNEHRLLINMQSAIHETKEISKHIIKAIEKQEYHFIVANLSCVDRAAHSGVLKNTIQTIEIIDKYIDYIAECALINGASLIITSDHGNSENIMNISTDISDPKHTTNPVPFILVNKNLEGKNLEECEYSGHDLSLVQPKRNLTDIAPTILKLLDISSNEIPGVSII